MKILRAKTKELFHSTLTPKQKANSALNLAELESGATTLQSYPRRIVLEMTSACNIKCIFCGRDEAEFNQTYLKIDVLDKLKPALEVCEEVTLFGWGEPTINPKFSEFLARLSQSDVRKYFVTNGMRLDKFIDDIFKYKVDIIAVSLDGATAEVNDKIRVGSQFSKITENIRKIKERKRLLGVDFPYMNFVFVAMESNIRELPKMVKLAKTLDMQEVKVVFLSAFSADMLKESLYNKQDLVREAFSEAIAEATRLNIKLKLPFIQGEDIAGDKYHKDCFVGWRDFFLGSDDSIRPCQSTSLKLGKFSEFDSFEEAWNSEAFKDFRKRVNANNCDKAISHDNASKSDSSLQIPPPHLQFRTRWSKRHKMQPRYATAMQTMLSKLPRKLEQTAELYPSRRDFRTAMGEKAQKYREQFRERSEKSQVDSSDCISLPHILNLAKFARFHRFTAIDSSDFKIFKRLKSANAIDSTNPINLFAYSSDSTHFSHLAESAGFSHLLTPTFHPKFHTKDL